MKQILINVSILLLLGYIGIGLFLYINQRSFIYFPTPSIPTTHTQVTLHNEGESINIFVLNDGKKDALLYFGGNAESMALSSDEIARAFPQFTLYLMDYRGYGGSTGEPSEEGLYSDAFKLYDTISAKHDTVLVGGRSLGSAIAVHVAAHREVSKLLLITPYDSMINVAQGIYPLFPMSLLLQDKYNNISRIKDIKAKTMIVVAEDDKIIHKERTQKLIDIFDTDLLEVKTIEDRGHNDISLDAAYYKSMQDFVVKR